MDNLLLKYSKDRPRPERKWDQFFATVETSQKRAEYVQKQGDLDAKIALLGDDDLTSITLAKLSQNKAGITVFEIDERLTTLIKRIAQKEGLLVNVVQKDLLEEFDKNYKQKYDIVFTDPPYTPAGISIFLNRALEVLKRAPTSRIYMCHGSGKNAIDREFQIQEIITKKGLLIEEKIEDFNEYRGAGTIGNTSSLYKLRFTPETKPSSYPGHRIYTNQ